MAFIKQSLDVEEPKAAPEGEAELRILKYEEKKTGERSKIPGEPYISWTIRIEEAGANYQPVYHTMMLVTKKTPDEHKEMYRLNQRRFLEVFGIPYEEEGFDPDDGIGQTGTCFLTQDEGDDGVVRNQLRLPKIKV